MGELTQIERAQRALASRTSRRSFLGTVGRGVVALVGGGFVASALAPERAEAYHICGHTYTTNSCPHPYAPLSRTDAYGWPMHPTYGYTVDDEGAPFTSPATQVRHKTCQQYTPMNYPFTGKPRHGGGWTRCCSGRLRHIQDCCSRSDIRINGDYAVRGYCPRGRKVFCITYRELNAKC
ncbi:MAG TPA: hypothetical protein VIB62_01350 [Actinomycetota bacterium]